MWRHGDGAYRAWGFRITDPIFVVVGRGHDGSGLILSRIVTGPGARVRMGVPRTVAFCFALFMVLGLNGGFCGFFAYHKSLQNSLAAPRLVAFDRIFEFLVGVRYSFQPQLLVDLAPFFVLEVCAQAYASAVGT